jgi:type IV pilus assembly protein PilM
MGKTIVGVDISANGLRAVELGGVSKARPTLLRHHSVALPPGAVNRGEVVEPRTVATALKQLWSTGGFTGKDVIIGIGNSRVLARDLSVPKASLKRIRESLPFQVQEMLPFPTEDALLDFYPINESVGENGPVVNGLLVAAVKDAVLGNVNAIQLAGLHAVEVDLVPFALSRVLLRGANAKGTTAVIDVGGNTTIVIVSTEGVPQFVRIISTGGDDLTNALSTRLNIPAENAETMKRTIGLSATTTSPEHTEVLRIMFELTSELVTSLRNTLSYFAGSRQGDVVSSIVLTGGGANLQWFAEALGEFTRLPVTRGNPLDTLDVSRRIDSAGLQAQGGSLAVAIGLALGSAA